jgi:hypothetical protein
VRALNIEVFVVRLDPSADPTLDNRVVFAAREDGATGADSPPPARRSGDPAAAATALAPEKKGVSLISPKIKRAVMAGLQKIFTRKKTDYLSRLTRHLLREDEGEHWPPELDFELTDPCAGTPQNS